jgi:hypothetical protein
MARGTMAPLARHGIPGLRRLPLPPSRICTDPIWRVALLYCALTLLLAYPLTRHPGSQVLSVSADTNLFMWALGWDTHALTHHPLSIFDANIYYPERHTLAYSENFIGSALFAAPILWLTDNPVLAMNIVSLLSCVLCGVGAFVLARRVGVGPSGAALTGLIFAFSPPRFLRLDQLHLITIQWVPFSLAFLHAYFDEGRRRDLHLAVAFFTLQALTSGHGAALLVLATLILIVYRFALGEPLAVVTRLRDFGLPGALWLAPTLLIFIPYRQVQIDMNLRRSLGDFTTFASSFLASPTHLHAFVLSALSQGSINDTANAYLFPGYLPLVLAAAAFLRVRAGRAGGAGTSTGQEVWWRRAGAVLEFLAVAALGIAAVVTANGPIRSKWGDTILLSIRTPWRAWTIVAVCVALRAAMLSRAPLNAAARLRRTIAVLGRWPRIEWRSAVPVYALITIVSVWIALGPPGGLWPQVYWWPGLNFIRVPSRFTLLSVLSIAVLAGIGFDRLTAGSTPRRRALLAAIAGAWLVAEFAAIPLGTQPFRVEIPAIDRWLAQQPTPFAIAEVPLDDETRQTQYMLHSAAHWQKTVEGYSGWRPPLASILYRQMRDFPDEASLDNLSQLGVTYIVVHTDSYSPQEWAAVEGRLRTYGARLTLAHTEGAGRVYVLRSSPPRSDSSSRR